MFFPYGDTPNPTNWSAWVNWGLIIVNVALFFVVTHPVGPEYHAYVLEHGYKPGAPEISDLFYSMFLHGGFSHLAGNMLFLWIYGDNIEHRLGRVRYLLVYLFLGVASTLSFAFFEGDSRMPLVGASGAISGVMGMYFVLFPRNQVRFLVFAFPVYMGPVLVPAWLVLGVYVIWSNLLPLAVGAGAFTNVAYGAHLGGFFAGLVLAVVGERRGWRLRTKEPPRPSVSRVRVRPVPMSESELARRYLDTGLQLLREGQGPMAWQYLARVMELDASEDVTWAAARALSEIDADSRLRKRP